MLVVFKVIFQGAYKKKLKKTKYFLFDPNPNLGIGDFQYHKLAFSNDRKVKILFLILSSDHS